ncbi:MAG: hypothetical protein QXU98_05105 [Candidatus Parvarchaeota archaeon]
MKHMESGKNMGEKKSEKKNTSYKIFSNVKEAESEYKRSIDEMYSAIVSKVDSFLKKVANDDNTNIMSLLLFFISLAETLRNAGKYGEEMYKGIVEGYGVDEKSAERIKNYHISALNKVDTDLTELLNKYLVSLHQKDGQNEKNHLYA